jgi:hypothetical protein
MPRRSRQRLGGSASSAPSIFRRIAVGFRKITNKGGVRKFIGKFPSFVHNKIIWYESRLERDFLYHLEFDYRDVLELSEQACRIYYVHQGKRRRFTVDFVVRRRNKNQIMEVKYSKRALQDKFQPAFRAASALGKLNGDEFSEFLTMKHIAAQLGVGPKAASDLIEHKCLQPARGPTIDGYAFWRFRKAALADFESQLKEQVVSPRGAEARIISFHHALRITQNVGYGVGSFVRAILDGKISPCSLPSRQVLADLKFLRHQISQLVRTTACSLNGDAVHATEAAKILKVKPSVVRFLCRTQIITSPRVKSYSRGWLIPRRAIEEFSSNYVRAAEIAKGLNTNSELLIEVLAAEGINPITEVRADKQL